MLKLILPAIFTFILKTVEVTFGSLKVILVTKNKKTLSALFAFIETIIWSLVVSSIISDIKSKPLILIAYCLGNAAGYALGSFIEDKMALGTVNVQVTSLYQNREKITKILESYNVGYSVTVSEGAKDTNCMFTAVLKRKNYRAVVDEIKNNVDNCFFTVTDVSKSIGGH